MLKIKWKHMLFVAVLWLQAPFKNNEIFGHTMQSIKSTLKIRQGRFEGNQEPNVFYDDGKTSEVYATAKTGWFY